MTTHEDRKKEAEARRKLEGNTLFDDLGDPIKQVLLASAGDGKKHDDETLKKLSKVSVKQLAKVYEMLGKGDDPEMIIMFLTGGSPEKKYARSAGSANSSGEGKQFFSDLERKQAEMMERMNMSAEEKAKRKALEDEARKKRVLEQKKKREEDEANESAAAEKEREAREAEEERKRKEAEEERKRREAEESENKSRQTKAKHEDPAADLDGGDWWKADEYKKSFEKTRDVAWWMVPSCYNDWKENGADGDLWTADDEKTSYDKFSGKNPKFLSARVSPDEKYRRETWYKANPGGKPLPWAATGAESPNDRCTFEQKQERFDYYKGGDWWKKDALAMVDPATLKKAGGGADREWWKQDKYHQDWENGGKKWKAISEQNAVQDRSSPEITQAELDKRDQWYKDNWWKSDKIVKEYYTDGSSARKWKKKDKSSSEDASPEELAKREEYFKGADDTDWWKDDTFVNDYMNNGDDGKFWTGAWKEAAMEGAGKDPMSRASNKELKDRKQWYDDNWWKGEEYVKDFQIHGSAGRKWKRTKKADDEEWWKKPEHIESYHAKKEKEKPQEWWQEPEILDDFVINGSKGKKWKAENAAAASVKKGDEFPAGSDEVSKRKKWMEDNFWKAPACKRDFEINGEAGKMWTQPKAVPKNDLDASAEPDSLPRAGEDELTRRKKFYKPEKEVVPSFLGATEGDSHFLDENPDLTDEHGIRRCTPAEAAVREQWYEDNWYQDPKIVKEYTTDGQVSRRLLKAPTKEVLKEKLEDDPDFQLPPEEQEAREKNLEGDKEWWKQPDVITEFVMDGGASKGWKGKKRKGDPEEAPADEVQKRKEWLEDNAWKCGDAIDDFQENGDKAELFTEGAMGAVKKRVLKEEKEKEAASPPKDEGANEDDKKDDKEESDDDDRDEPVTVYITSMTGSALIRGHCRDMMSMVDLHGIPFETMDVADNKPLRQELTAKCGKFLDVPLLFVGDTFIGQYPAVDDLIQDGQFMPTMHEAGMKKRGKWATKASKKRAPKQEFKHRSYDEIMQADYSKHPYLQIELDKRREWLKDKAIADDGVQKKREEWLKQQVTDEEYQYRRDWMKKKLAEGLENIPGERLKDALVVHKGSTVSDDEIKSIKAAIREKRLGGGGGSNAKAVDDPDVTRAELDHAIKATEFGQ